MRFVFDGKRVEWHCDGADNFYYTTNNDGDGVFVVYPSENSRRQLIGTCDFYLRGSRQAIEAKIRRFFKDKKDK